MAGCWPNSVFRLNKFLYVVINKNLSWLDHNNQIHDSHIFTRVRKPSHPFLINIDDVLL